MCFMAVFGAHLAPYGLKRKLRFPCPAVKNFDPTGSDGGWQMSAAQ